MSKRVLQINPGDRLGKWTVLEILPTKPYQKRTVSCVCDCANVGVVRVLQLVNGLSRSCGCLRGRTPEEGENTTGSIGRLRRIWMTMRTRCENPKVANYKWYGGSGVTVCSDWQSCDAFMEWSLANGYKDWLTIDRIDANKGYSPDNCKWSTIAEQKRSKRRKHIITAYGETKMVAEWAEDPRCLVDYHTLLQRTVYSSWDPERAMTTPKTKFNRERN